MDLSTRIRLGLAEGKSPDVVVSELVAGGMTESLKQVDQSGELDRVAGTDPEASVRDCANAAIAAIKEANPDAFRRSPD